MRFRVEHDALAEAVAWVARALPSKPVLPVLAGMKLEAGEELALSCFDYELSAAARVPAEIAEPGTALVPGRLLAEITRSLPGQPAEFGSGADEVTLTCGSAEFTLVSLPQADYPALPPVPPLAGTADGGELAAAVAQVLPAVSRDDTLPMLTAVCLDIDGDSVTLAATDRYRLAVRTLRWEPAQAGLRAVALVPGRMLADAARTMAAGTPVSVAFTAGEDPGAGRRGPRPAEGMIAFDSAERRLTGRLIAGEFIRYESRFPAEFRCSAEVPAAQFIDAVRRVSLVADRASPVRLTFGRGQVVIEAQTEGRARAVETVPASYQGDQPSIAFNPQYLLDGLTAAAQGGAAAPAPIRLEFTSPAKPALITLAAGDGTEDGAGGEPAGGVGPEAANGAGDGGDGSGARDDGAGAHATPPPPDFRYLVVPLRPLARA